MHPFETLGGKLWVFAMNLCVPQRAAKLELHPEGTHARTGTGKQGCG